MSEILQKDCIVYTLYIRLFTLYLFIFTEKICPRHFPAGRGNEFFLQRKIITYRDQKRFNQDYFLRDFDSSLLQGELYKNCDEPYKKLTEISSRSTKTKTS